MKKVLFAICTIAMLLTLSSCAEKPQTKEIGIQLYSVRSLIGGPEKYAANHVEVLKAIADMGYTQVEPANYDGEGHLYGVDPEQFRADVEAVGMKVVSSHVGHQMTPEHLAAKDFTEELEWWKVCIDCHKRAGVKYIVMPSMPRNLEKIEDVQTYCDYYNAIGALCAKEGIKFGYHNHSFEFVKIEDQMFYDYMIEHTNPELVFFQMDVWWAVRGNASPVEYFNRYPGRFTCLHIKDKREVGQSGMVGFDAIFKNAGLAGCKDIVVELEGPGVEDDILKSCAVSAQYLIEAPFVPATYTE